MYKKFRLAWPFLLPGLAGLLIFYGIPFVGGIWYSVTDGKVQNAFVGLENYISVWNNTMFQMGLKNTMELSLICAPLLFLLSFVLAAGLTFWLSTTHWGRALLRRTLRRQRLITYSFLFALSCVPFAPLGIDNAVTGVCVFGLLWSLLLCKELQRQYVGAARVRRN